MARALFRTGYNTQPARLVSKFYRSLGLNSLLSKFFKSLRSNSKYLSFSRVSDQTLRVSDQTLGYMLFHNNVLYLHKLSILLDRLKDPYYEGV